MFVVNSQYDEYNLYWPYNQPCFPHNCDNEGMASFKHYKDEFDGKIQPVLSSPLSNGYFLDSCIIHCQTNYDDVTWSAYAIDGRTVAQSFGDWYFDRPASTRLKDCDTDFPCNPTCSEAVYTNSLH